MSFLSKRSRSQRSFKRGSEEISVRRLEQSDAIIQCRTESFPSDSSSSPPNATNFALYDSCVLRKFPKHKSSHLRFLAWVAYTRKFTDDPITEDERRTCPLLWCRHVFKDQETMLQHVWECEHLAKGLYWCFHCQRPEKIGSFECRRCQGTPSKSDRITTVAKRIFSKLGSKRHRTQPAPESEPDMSIAKYSETAKTLENHPDFASTYDAGPTEGFDTTEMSSARLLEGSPSWPRISQELPDTQICEMTGSECPLELGTGAENWMTQDFPACPEKWFNPSVPIKNDEHPKSRGSLDMLPPLNTQLGQGHLVGNFSGTGPASFSDEPMSATIISPLGADDRFASIFQEISPTDTEESGVSFLTDSGYTSATVLSSWGSSSMPNFELHPGFNEPRGKKRWRDDDYAIEDRTHDASTAVSRNHSAKSSRSAKRKAHNAIESATSTHSPSRCPSTKKPKMQSPHWSSAATLVQSFSEVLDAHIYHTKEILQYIPQTPITTELQAMSRSSLVSIGLEALAGIIEGRNPTAIVQAFAFTHIAYAFTIAMDHDEIKVHTQEWFQDSLSWVDGLGSERERARYSKIAQAIWQPVESLSEGEPPRLFSADKENRLYLVCKRFLDVLESFDSSNAEATTSGAPDHTQIAFSKRAQTQVIDELIKTVSIEAFIEDVVKVEKRLKRGHIKSVRELELELMCAGKCASQSEPAYNRFLAHVTHRCNSLYDSSPARSRAEHHIRDIAIVKKLLPEESYSDQGQEEEEEEEEEREFELELEDDLPLGFKLDTLGRCDKRLGDSLNEFVRDADNSLASHCDISRCNSTHSQPAHVTIPPRRPKASEKHQLPSISHKPTPLYDSTSRPSQKRPRSNYHESPSTTLHFSPNQSESVNSSLTPNSTSIATPLPAAQSSSPQSFQCSLCDYIPMGEEKWKASNLRRHKRTQHASKGSYLCKWPGCTKSFTRSDNLRSHMKAQGHGLGAGFTKGGECDEDEEEEEEDIAEAREMTRGSEERWSWKERGERGAKRRRAIRE